MAPDGSATRGFPVVPRHSGDHLRGAAQAGGHPLQIQNRGRDQG